MPLSVNTQAANRHDVTLVQNGFDFYMIGAKPEKPIGEKASDSDPPDQTPKDHCVGMIAPHRSNRTLETRGG